MSTLERYTGPRVMPTPDPAHLRELEASEWLRRIRAEGHKRASGHRRLQGILDGIERARGREARLLLEQEIMRQLSESRKR